jgi:hypothetical protein
VGVQRLCYVQMIEFLALVRGPAPGEAVAEGFADEEAQRLAFELLRPRLLRRLVDDRLPSWALLNLEQDRNVVAAARAAARLQSRLEALRELERARRRVTLTRREVPALATVIEARRACTRAQRDFQRRIRKIDLQPTIQLPKGKFGRTRLVQDA